MLPLPVRKRIKYPKVDKIQKKIPKRTKKKRERNKEPWRPPKIRKRIKKREGATLLSFIPHWCFRVAPVLQFVESFHVVLA